MKGWWIKINLIFYIIVLFDWVIIPIIYKYKSQWNTTIKRDRLDFSIRTIRGDQQRDVYAWILTASPQGFSRFRGYQSMKKFGMSNTLTARAGSSRLTVYSNGWIVDITEWLMRPSLALITTLILLAQYTSISNLTL